MLEAALTGPGTAHTAGSSFPALQVGLEIEVADLESSRREYRDQGYGGEEGVAADQVI
jgi:hypothetical protein